MSEKSLSEIKVKDIMSKSLITAVSTTTIFQAAKMMENLGVGAIIVKKDDSQKGIITDRDFAIKIAVNKLPPETPIDDVASYPLVTIKSDQLILDAADIMARKKIRKLAVEENNSIVGIITSTDLVNNLSKIK